VVLLWSNTETKRRNTVEHSTPTRRFATPLPLGKGCAKHRVRVGGANSPLESSLALFSNNARMTITKKVGSLLLLLTVGSLVGIATFAIFLQRTSVNFLFFLAASNEERLLQQLYVNTVMIRDGHDDLRASQRDLIDDFDDLLNALEHGGPNTSGLSPIRAMEQLRVAAAYPGGTLESTGPEVVKLLTDAMPLPPQELSGEIIAVRQDWLRLKTSFSIVVERPKEDPATGGAFETIRAGMPGVSQASRLVAATSAARLLEMRRQMLITLASIAGLSIVLFAIGLLFTRRFIARPVQSLQTSSQRIGAGDFSHRVPAEFCESNDELASLGRTFNSMADQIQRSLERYRELFENATDFVYTTDLNGRFLTVNRAAEMISGYSREELLQKNIVDLMGSSLEPTPVAREVQMLSKDGKRISLEDSHRLIHENGTPVGIQGLARDISERNRLKEKLDLAQRMEAVGRLAGGIAHDFGNVLTIVSGYCTLIRDRLKQDDPLRPDIEGMYKASQRAASMVRQLLSFSKEQVVHPRLLSPRKAIRELTELLSRLIGEDIQLVIKFAPDVGNVKMDPTQFEQIFVNLVMNARDSMPKGGNLRIEAVNEDAVPPRVRMTVIDTGCGMPPEVLSRIFEPFFSTKSKGTGLGLSSVYSIVRQADGEISAESGVGTGTRFTIHLPRVIEVSGDEELAISLRNGHGNERILLVEDEADVRRLVRAMLHSEGYTVIEAVDQNHAIDLFQRPDQEVDLVLTDVVMPNMSGPELADRLRTIRPDIKVLFMSGYPRDKFEETRKRGETFHFIQKPLYSKTLAAKVRGVLDGEAKEDRA
jgi:PAS domain S-box-containing protein